MRVISFIIGFIVLTLTTLATSSFASIGEVKLHTGFATVDIDTEDDWKLAEAFLIQSRMKSLGLSSP